MTPDQVLDRMQNGWELANRGTGWWISEPRRAYKRCESERVDDLVVDALIKRGIIAIFFGNQIVTELPYTTLWARLTPAGQPQTPAEKTND